MLRLTSLENQLSALVIAFDYAIAEDESFLAVKVIYMQIKELQDKIADRQIELLKYGRAED